MAWNMIKTNVWNKPGYEFTISIPLLAFTGELWGANCDVLEKMGTVNTGHWSILLNHFPCTQLLISFQGIHCIYFWAIVYMASAPWKGQSHFLYSLYYSYSIWQRNYWAAVCNTNIIYVKKWLFGKGIMEKLHVLAKCQLINSIWLWNYGTVVCATNINSVKK